MNELVFAKFNDGLYYRGVCKNVRDQLALIYFLDYGGLENVDIKEIMMIPINFLYTICAHTCHVRFTGAEISNLNLEATVNKLFDEQHITCCVEKLTNYEYPYLITIDKSFAVITS